MTEEIDKTQDRLESKTWIEKLTHALTGEPQNLNELTEILQDAVNRGILNQNTLSMIEGVLSVQQQRVKDIAVPRPQVVFIELSMQLPDIISTVVKSGHSRFPVVGENKDEVLGILLAKDLLAINNSQSQNTKFNIKENLRHPVFIPESKKLDSLLDDFKKNRSHMAIVVDEYGGVTGLVTIEDVLEQIVGEIEDEFDTDDDPYILQSDDKSYYIKAITPIEEFNEHFNCLLDESDVDTIGGYILHKIGHLPKPGEAFEIDGFNIKIVRSNTRKILLIKVTPNDS